MRTWVYKNLCGHTAAQKLSVTPQGGLLSVPQLLRLLWVGRTDFSLLLHLSHHGPAFSGVPFSELWELLSDLENMVPLLHQLSRLPKSEQVLVFKGAGLPQQKATP